MIDWIAQHLLTVIIFLPAAGAALLLLFRPEQAAAVRRTALAVSVASLLLCGWATRLFLQETGVPGSAGRVVLEERANWLVWPAPGAAGPRLEIQYAVGLDGISLPLLLLTALLTPLAMLASASGIRERVREYYALLLLLHSAMLGVFCAQDLLLFYVFFEFTLLPLYLIIAIWGGAERRRAANMFFIYTLAGSVFTFAGLLYLAWAGFERGSPGQALFTFDMQRLSGLAAGLPVAVQTWLFAAFFAGFAIKVPVFPFHTWLPLAHTEAPTAGSAILAGVLLKLGTYGFLRISLPMFPDATRALAPTIAVLAVVGIIYGALAAWVQRDIKKLVAYSSVSHLGFCMLGLFCLNLPGLTGALLYMVNHGLATAALFFVVGMIYERYHTRRIDELGGLARRMPRLAFFLIVFTLASIGLPGMNGFVSEFLVLLGTFTSGQPGPGGTPPGPLGIAYAAFAATGVVFSALYLLHMCRCVLFGPLREPPHGHEPPADLPADLGGREVTVLAPIAALCLILGVVPRPLIDMMQPALHEQALARLERPAARVASVSPVVPGAPLRGAPAAGAGGAAAALAQAGIRQGHEGTVARKHASIAAPGRIPRSAASLGEHTRGILPAEVP